MTRDVNVCRAVVARLQTLLKEGTALSPAERTHLAECPECGRLLEAVQQLERALEAEPASAPASEGGAAAARIERVAERAEEEARRVLVRRLLVGGGTLAVLVAGYVWLSSPGGAGLGVQESVFALVILGLLFGVGVLLPVLALRELNAGIRARKVYKRMRGKRVSGVCIGIAEAFRLDVTLCRLSFVVLAFLKIGIPLYLLLSLMLDVHPEDREHLLRFKARRWWRRRFGGASPDGVLSA